MYSIGETMSSIDNTNIQPMGLVCQSFTVNKFLYKIINSKSNVFFQMLHHDEIQ